jgi:TfoX/Sxy family transcriptional regulator of competence genes
MASTKDFLDFIVDQIKNQDLVRSKKMFGEYALYYDNKVVALICDNELYIKNTPVGKKIAEEKDLEFAAPFPGAKDWILIGDDVEDRDFLNEILEITRESLGK